MESMNKENYDREIPNERNEKNEALPNFEFHNDPSLKFDYNEFNSFIQKHKINKAKNVSCIPSLGDSKGFLHDLEEMNDLPDIDISEKKENKNSPQIPKATFLEGPKRHKQTLTYGDTIHEEYRMRFDKTNDKIKMAADFKKEKQLGKALKCAIEACISLHSQFLQNLKDDDILCNKYDECAQLKIRSLFLAIEIQMSLNLNQEAFKMASEA